MNILIDIKLLLLLGIANGIPVLAKDILGTWMSFPLDGHVRLSDGHELLGTSKTLRGVILSLMATGLVAPIVGIVWSTGLLIAALAMLGDVFSSFLKRRLRLAPSSMAIGLDQLPESLFPLLVCAFLLALSVADVALTAACFLGVEVLLSKWLYKVHLRDRPY